MDVVAFVSVAVLAEPCGVLFPQVIFPVLFVTGIGRVSCLLVREVPLGKPRTTPSHRR